MPLDRDNKMNLVAASFSYFGRTFMKKKNLSSKIVIVINAIIPLYYKETN